MNRAIIDFLDDAYDVLLAPLRLMFDGYCKVKQAVREAVHGPTHPRPPFNTEYPTETTDTYLAYMETTSMIAYLESEYGQSMKRLKQHAYRNRFVSEHEVSARKLGGAMKRRERLATYFEAEIAALHEKQEGYEQQFSIATPNPRDFFGSEVEFDANGQLVIPRGRNETIAYFDEVLRQTELVRKVRHPLSKRLQLILRVIAALGMGTGVYGAVAASGALLGVGGLGLLAGIAGIVGLKHYDRRWTAVHMHWWSNRPKRNRHLYDRLEDQ